MASASMRERRRPSSVLGGMIDVKMIVPTAPCAVRLLHA